MSSASTPKQDDPPSKSAGDSAAGPAQGRPSFTSRLRDLLAVSSWRILKGETGRLKDVQDDLTIQATATNVQGALEGQHGTAPPSSTAAAPPPLGEGRGPEAAAAAADAAAATASGGRSLPEQALQAQLQQGNALQQQPLSMQRHEEKLQEGQQQQRLLHPKYGYAALGGVMPAEVDAGSAGALVGMLRSQHPRVNPQRRFMPGEMYEPQDLNPFATRVPDRTRPNADAVRRPTAAEVMEKADYKNVAFLSRWFMSPAGRMLSRRQTRLPIHVHKYVSRQIKLARHMGLMAGEARLDKLHLGRLRERELLEAQRRAAAAAAVAGVVAGGAAGATAAAASGSAASSYQRLAELGGA